jgi:hypothetical protein
MSNLMKLFGTLMAVLGVVLGVTILAKPGLLDAMGIRLDTAVLLLVGGVLALGLGSVIDALRSGRPRSVVESVGTTRAESAAVPPEAVIPNFGRKPAETAAIAAGAAVASVTVAEATAKSFAEAKKADPVAETISALEQAKADVIKSMGGMDAVTSSSESKPAIATVAPKPAGAVEIPAVVEEEPAAEEEADEDLYVVEEKVIRGRPARILSDDTVEAETDEGWMRFENLEHLNEYLDSVEEQAT